MSSEEKKELIEYRFGRAKEALEETDILVNHKLWNLAVNRLYYACFYAVSALLASKTIYTKTHSGAKNMLGLHFVKTGVISEKQNQFYIRIFSMRQSGDYEDYCDYDKEDVMELIAPAKDFINTIEQLLDKQ